MKLGTPRQFRVPGVEPPRPLLEMAESLRRLIETMLRVVVYPPDLCAAMERVRAEVDALEQRLAPAARDDARPSLRAGPRRPYYTRPLFAPDHHPLRPDLVLHFADGVTRGRVRFGVTFEGPPGCVHGGFVAHFYDEVLGQHAVEAGVGGMTGNLRVHYHRATPVLRDLDFEVEHERQDARKAIARGRLLADGQLLSEGEALFIRPRSAPR